MKTPAKHREIYGLSKIPDDEFIKNLRTELGKANAIIEELRHENRQLKSTVAISKDERIEVRKNELCLKYQKKIKELEKIIRQKNKSISDLIVRIVKVEKSI